MMTQQNNQCLPIVCRCIASALILGLTAPAWAAPNRLPQPNQAQQPDCTSPLTQAEINICASQSLQRADRDLNSTYQRLLPNLSSKQRQQLTNAQLAWIRFRDTECDFSGSAAEGGSMQPVIVSGCREQLTQQRTADLQAYLRARTVLPRGDSYVEVDRLLNQRYRRLRLDLTPGRKTRLETAELAWIAFRDSACAFEAGSGGNTARDRCLIRITEQRNQQFQNHLKTN